MPRSSLNGKAAKLRDVLLDGFLSFDPFHETYLSYFGALECLLVSSYGAKNMKMHGFWIQSCVDAVRGVKEWKDADLFTPTPHSPCSRMMVLPGPDMFPRMIALPLVLLPLGRPSVMSLSHLMCALDAHPWGVWVKGPKDEVKRTKGPPTRGWGPECP